MKLPHILAKIRQKPSTIWATSSLMALINRLIYTLTIACIPDLLQHVMHEPRSSNGIVTAAYGLGGLVAGVFVGYMSDRLQNRVISQMVAAMLYTVAGGILYGCHHFYQVILFRLVLGAASAIADTMLFTAVADVYPANLLGFKMGIIFVFDNVGNMLGPWLGGKTYEHTGVKGIAAIAIVIGLVELLMVLVFVKNSLDIRKDNKTMEEETKPVNGRPETMTEASMVNSVADTMDENDEIRTQSDNHHKLQLLKLLIQLPVIGPTMSILVGNGLQSTMETTLPLRLFDKLHYSPGKIGIVFLAIGGIMILVMPAMGYLTDRLIAQRGERVRYYTIALGSLLMLASLVITSVAESYGLLMCGYAFFAIVSMSVIVPAQSAFGDFINGSELLAANAMAQCYSLAWVAEGIANIVLPPVASALYDAYGFMIMLVSMSTVLCTLCLVAVLAYPLHMYVVSKKSLE